MAIEPSEDIEVRVAEDQTRIPVDMGDEEVKRQNRVEYDEDAPNLVPQMKRTKRGMEELERLATRVYDEVTAAWDGQEEYRKRAREQWELFSQKLKKKDLPFEDCANLRVPILLENISRLYMYSYLELYGDWTNVFGVLPVGPDDREQAEIMSVHDNWQLATQLTDFPTQMERAAMFLYMPGDVFAHSFWDSARRRNRHEVLSVDSYVIPFVLTTTELDLSDCPWKAKWLFLYKHEIQAKRGEWDAVDTLLGASKPSFDNEPDQPLADSLAKNAGIVKDDEQRAPYKLIHYEGWQELPNQDRQRNVKVVMDWATRQVMQVQILEEDNWQDRARYEREAAELEQYRAAHGAASSHNANLEQLAAQGFPMPLDEMGMEQAPMELPPPPQWADPERLADPAYEPEPVRKDAIQMFTHQTGILAPTGPLGTGIGRILTDQTIAAQTIMNQAVDLGTLNNAWTLLMAGRNNLPPDFKITPGKINVLPGVSSNDLAKLFIPLQAPPPNPMQFEMVRMISQWAQGAAQSHDVMSGAAGKSGETARGIQTRLEQATKQASFMTGKLGRFTTQLIKNNAKLNAMFMPDEEVIYVNNHKIGSGQLLKVGRKMWERDYRVVMKSDLRFTSQAQRIEEADGMFEMVTTSPVFAANLPLHQRAAREVFISRGRDDMLPYLGPEAPPPETPMGIPLPPPPGAAPPPGADPNAPPADPNAPPPPAPEPVIAPN